MKAVFMGALCAIMLGTSLVSHAQVSPEEQIKLRKAGYSFMAWNMGKIKAQVVDRTVEYNPGQILAAATAISAISHSGMGALFGPGTEGNVGEQTTRVAPALFNNMPDVALLSADLNRATANLQEQAKSGNQSAVRAAFGEVGQACKACHDKYRTK